MRYQPRMQGSVMPGSGSYPRFETPQQMGGNSRVLGYLGRALSLEFSAGQHYLAQASLAKFRNEMNYAQGFVTLANEEFQHANLLTDRMVAQGALPSGSVLSPATPASSIAEALRSCEARELALIQLYGEATQYCANMGAAEDHALFSRLLEEEQAQLMRINGWLEEFYHSMQVNQAPSRGFV
ncbi:ferritin-like domain-containing protein [Thiomicrorhabdus chilensis]|uniref:ferritin-like domain-containing protein n=1 Tax=Thiomicrorhabdus chilensis TaxID=63656 RepID=UPI0003F78822|nr:ferritin-like domain-containing protein [Thiomicrorhabdus chilensis]